MNGILVGKLAKLYVAIGGGVLTGIEGVYPDTLHWLPAVSAAITAALVYLVPNATASDTTVKPEEKGS